MTQSDEHDGGDEFEIPPWDAAAIARQRADQRRTERDTAIADLRDTMSDEEILDAFGIDPTQIEG